MYIHVHINIYIYNNGSSADLIGSCDLESEMVAITVVVNGSSAHFSPYLSCVTGC